MAVRVVEWCVVILPGSFVRTTFSCGLGFWISHCCLIVYSPIAHRPESPSKQEQEQMRDFVEAYIKVYPCGYCGDTSYQVRGIGQWR